jgi:dipeptidyl aminopeptidase/acylaminoacyl peptidase
MLVNRWSRLFRACAALVLCVVAASHGARAAESLAVADFFRSADVEGLVMSPNAKYVAATVSGGDRGRRRLVMLDLQDFSKSKVLAAFSDADVHWIGWVNDNRLVFNVVDQQESYANQFGQGLFAVDREGKEPVRRLIKRLQFSVTEATRITDRELSVYHRFHSLVRDGSDDVLVQLANYDGRNELARLTLLRLNTSNGRTRSLSEGAPEGVRSWVADLQGRPRVVTSQVAGTTRIYWRRSDDAPWDKVSERPTFSERGYGQPAYFGLDAEGRLYFSGVGGNGVDTTSLMRLKVADKTASAETLLSLDGYDFDGTLVFNSTGHLLGVRYLTDARATHWFDPRLAQIQRDIDKLMPATNNELSCGDCDQPGSVLVKAQSDRQPPAWYLYDSKTAEPTLVGRSRPWIDPRTMAQRDMVRVKTRDGLNMPVHVTRPRNAKGAAPMVVLVHGGPWVRGGEWEWDADSQFLASRGYVVVEPEFRGSTGFGWKHFHSGFKQWGLAMQDDVADAARWAIEQGYADPQRICIAGASYGGYAALMGLVRNPELFRCAVEWVGVSDIDLMYSIHWSDLSSNWTEYGMPVMVGDREKDAEQLGRTSPIKLANRITQPLLMAYGGADPRVPIDHGTKMRDALAPHNKQVEWVEYPDEGHGFLLEANRVDFYSRMERFLDKNLKNAR